MQLDAVQVIFLYWKGPFQVDGLMHKLDLKLNKIIKTYSASIHSIYKKKKHDCTGKVRVGVTTLETAAEYN